jgi:molybdopterin molybdotransferase
MRGYNPAMTTRQGVFGHHPVSVEDALAIILPAAAPGQPEEVRLSEAAGRVLAAPVVASEDLWPFVRSAMDGIAVRAADVATASADHPVRLRITDAVYAGDASQQALAGGTAARVATGAPVPPGADAVIPQELLSAAGDDVLVSHAAARGANIFPAGEDVRAGDRVLHPGTVLRGGHLSLLAAMGHARVLVRRRPAVAILTCGDELIEPADPLRPGLVRESNSYAIATEVAALGASPRRLGNARDVTEELDAKVRDGLTADVLVTCGGLSVGERDLIRPALRRAGVTFAFEGVAMKPGAPAAFGRLGERMVFALPGTPSACRVAFEVLVVPALRAMLGYDPATRPAVTARLAAPLRVKSGRRRYLWGRAVLRSDGVWVSPLMQQSTAALRSASDANALIIVDASISELAWGAQVPVHLLSHDALPFSPREPAVIGIAGARGAGKTTLIERLIPALALRGITVASVRHHVHQRLLDQEGTDTERAASAGAVRTVLAGPGGITVRSPAEDDPPLSEVLAHAGGARVILVEGYTQSDIPKILVRRTGVETDKAPPAGPILAVVDDTRDAAQRDADHHFTWEAIDALAAFIAHRLK